MHLPNSGMEPVSLAYSALAGGFFAAGATWEVSCVHLPELPTCPQLVRCTFLNSASTCFLACHPLPTCPWLVKQAELFLSLPSSLMRSGERPAVFRTWVGPVFRGAEGVVGIEREKAHSELRRGPALSTQSRGPVLSVLFLQNAM